MWSRSMASASPLSGALFDGAPRLLEFDDL
jgi:hypothetical protein